MTIPLLPPPLDPVLYHAHHLLRAEDVPFWQSLADEYGSPILELGAGTGRVLLALAGEGRSLTGIDHDPDMLAFFRAAAPVHMRPHFVIAQADMRSLNLQERFALVLLPCNTFSTFPAEERNQIARSVARHLRPEGVFAFSIPNPHLLAALDPIGQTELEDSFIHPQSGKPVEVYSQWERSGDSLTFTWRYDHHSSQGIISQWAQTRHHLDTPEMYLDELQQAGFAPAELFGDYDRTPYDAEESTYLIVLAKKASL